MQKIVCTFFLICLSLSVNAQEVIEKGISSAGRDTIIEGLNKNIFSLKGRIISINDKKPQPAIPSW